MNYAQEGDLFPRRQPKRNPVPLTQKEAAILRLAHAYGISDIAVVKLILLLRSREKTANSKSKDGTIN